MKPKPAKPRTKGNRNRPPRSNRDFLIVAIGASAGGLEAVTELFRNLPPDTGMAFVLIQHLDPKHHSLLTELVSRETSMSVVEVREGMVIEPNHAYVIPPNTTMSVSKRTLRLLPREEVRGRPMTIDAFMRSLAEDHGSSSVGVILSGSGSDGTLGITEIHAQGGVTFAQDETSAKHDGMPRSAIATGSVNFVLSPKGIARELARIADHPWVVRSRVADATEPVPGEHLGRSSIFRLLRKSTGVDFTYYRDTTIRRRLQRRMVVHKIEKLHDYQNYIEQNPAEMKALYRDLLINVTSFFRNPRVFEALKTQVFPRIVRNRPSGAVIRIWAPGCSSGEETYSLAIALLEYLGDKSPAIPAQLFGTDVSESSIIKARAGYYPENIQADISPERLRRFFLKVEGGYRVSKNVRDMCIFAQHNVLSDPPFSQMDAICCRNLLIYLEPVLQKKVIALFHYALRATGFLVLGTSEGVGTLGNLFALDDRADKIFVKKTAAARPVVSFSLNKYMEHSDPGGTTVRPAPKQPETNWNYVEAQKEFDRRLLSQYAPAAVFINEDFEVVHSRGPIDRYLKMAPGRASLSLLKMAREGLLFELRNALNRAKKDGVPVRKHRIQVKKGDGAAVDEINVEITPIQVAHTKETYFMIVFEGAPPLLKKHAPRSSPSAAAARQVELDSRRSAKLEQELAATQEYLHSVIESQEATNEELQSANEEILSSNEELQSTNEELETSKEELQSTNEELSTVNDELRNRNTEITQINNDFSNLLASVHIGIVMLGCDLTIRRFTPPAQKIFGLIPADVGRPFANINPSIQGVDLQSLSAGVMKNLTSVEREVRSRDGNSYFIQVLPYRTMEDRIDGVILAAIDTHLRAGEGLRHDSGETRIYASGLIESAREYSLVLDEQLRIRAASPTFYAAFGLDPALTANTPLTQCGHGEWNLPVLRKALDSVLRDGLAGAELDFEHEVPQLGRKSFHLIVTRTESAETRLLVLWFQDTSAKAELEGALRHQAEVLDLFHDAVLLRDLDNHIRFWNQSARKLYGYSAEEVFGKESHDLLKTRFPVSPHDADSAVRAHGLWEGQLLHTTRAGKTVQVYSRWGLIRGQGSSSAILEINREIESPSLKRRPTPGT
jgi:two-component system CheB/CheR fusion protein